VSIERPSVTSLFLEPCSGDSPLGVATGFVVARGSHKYLITNRHIATGRHQETGQPLHQSGGLPSRIGIWHHVPGRLGAWEHRYEELLDSKGKPRWFVHPIHYERVDVVALALTDTAGIDFHTYPLREVEPKVALAASTGVFIIGYPFGITGGGKFGVWSRGSVATEPDVDWGELPVFLVDSRTRPGQSGSPVIQYFRGGAVPMADGGTAIFSGTVERLVGIYSGRVNAESDLGFVWKHSVLGEILSGGQKERIQD